MNKSIVWFVILSFAASQAAFAAKTEKPEQKFFPEKVEADKNYDGTPDFAEYFRSGKIEHREADTDYDGAMDEWTYFDENGKPIKTERDTNKDGKADTWINYDNSNTERGGAAPQEPSF